MATLGTLRTRLDGKVNRTDTDYTSNRDTFINEGLRWLQKKVDVTDALFGFFEQEELVQPGTEYITLHRQYRPSDHLTVWRLDAVSGKRVALRRIPVDYLSAPFFDQLHMAEVNLSDTSVWGTPAYYAPRGGIIEIRPPAAEAFTARIEGQVFLPDLVNAQDENLLTCEAEDACLYAAIAQAWLHFEDEGRVKFWQEHAFTLLKEWEADRRLQDRVAIQPLVMRPPGSGGSGSERETAPTTG